MAWAKSFIAMGHRPWAMGHGPWAMGMACMPQFGHGYMWAYRSSSHRHRMTSHRAMRHDSPCHGDLGDCESVRRQVFDGNPAIAAFLVNFQTSGTSWQSANSSCQSCLPRQVPGLPRPVTTQVKLNNQVTVIDNLHSQKAMDWAQKPLIPISLY